MPFLLLRRQSRRLPLPQHAAARSFAAVSHPQQQQQQQNRTTKPKKTLIDLKDGAVDGIGQAHRAVIGPRTLVVSAPYGRPEEPHVQRVLARLRGVGIQCGTFSMLERYPTTQAVDEGAMIAKRMGAQSVVGVGGGSVLDLAKGVAALACTRDGGCREHLRVYHKEKELPTERLAVVTVPTTASTGGGAVGPQSLVLYEPEEALVPLHAQDLAPDVAVVDPTLFATVPPQMQLAQALGALSVCFDALACGSARGTLDLEGMEGLILQGAQALCEGMKVVDEKEDTARRRKLLAEGSMVAGQLLGLVQAPPVQSLARCLAPLFPLASYSQLTTVLLRSYLAVLADRQQQGDLGADVFNEALLRQLAATVCPGKEPPGLLEMAEWVWEHSQRAGIRTLTDYRASDKEEKTAEALSTQVSSVLELFHVEGGETLDAEVVRDVIEVSLGT